MGALPQRRVFTEEDALEREFSPDLVNRAQLKTDTAIAIVNATDDLQQLQQEREMVLHREMEALSCLLMEKKQVAPRSGYHSSMAFDYDVE